MRRHLVLLAAAICIAAATSFFPIAPPASAGPIEAMAPGGAGAEDLQFVELSRLREPDLRVTMKFTRTSADRVLMALSGAADLDLRFEGARPVTLVDLDAESMSLKQALQRLSRIAGVRYRVPDPDTLIAFVPKTVLDAPAQELDLARSENEALVGILLAGMDGVGLPTRVEESYVKPVYPEDAREQRVEGRVILQAVIRGDGSVGDVQVLNSTPPDLGFEKAAIEAVERWRYDPAMKDGKPVDVYFTVRVDFDLQ